MSVVKGKRKVIKPNGFQKFCMNIARPFLRLVIRVKFGCKLEKPMKIGEPFIAISNHTTDNDNFYLIAAVKDYMYYVCSEHLFRQGLISKIMVAVANPIPMFKGSVGLSTTAQILKRVRDGNSIGIFPEGSRTFNGVTNPIAESTGKLIKKAKCGLLTFRQEGGYFVAPRWAKKTRKGPISARIIKYYTKAEVEKMTVDEINEIINRDLYNNAYETQMKNPKKYIGKDKAEGIENFCFICPKCHSFETIYSKGDDFFCKKCGKLGTYDDYGFLQGENFPFKTVLEWGKFVDEEFDKLYDETKDLSFENENVTLTSVSDEHVETVLLTDTLYGDKDGFSIGDRRFDFLQMEATEFINLGNTFMFTYKDGVHYTMTTGYLNSVKYRKMYFKRILKEAELTGRKVDLAK